MSGVRDGKKTILVVDDDGPFRKAVVDFLADTGFSVTGAGSVEEAIVKLEDGVPALAIIDVQLPGRSGISMLHELHDRKACFPVIMFSGNATSQVRRECMSAGAACFVSKPVAPDVLLEIVNETLDGE